LYRFALRRVGPDVADDVLADAFMPTASPISGALGAAGELP